METKCNLESHGDKIERKKSYFVSAKNIFVKFQNPRFPKRASKSAATKILKRFLYFYLNFYI